MRKGSKCTSKIFVLKMRFTHLFILLIFFILLSCKHQDLHVSKIEGSLIPVDTALSSAAEIEDFIKPYRENIQKDLDSVLAYAPKTYSKTDGEFNTAIGNFMADVVYEEGNPIFNSRTGKNIDMVILNYGGIRSIIPKGNISKRTAYKLMPFENSIVIVALKGSQVDKLISYLSQRKKAHPVSKLQLELNPDFSIKTATIKGKPIEPSKTYYVATNDYLYNGGDSMTFFKPNEGLHVINYKIRNAIIDHFIKVDTINPVRDQRFIQKN